MIKQHLKNRTIIDTIQQGEVYARVVSVSKSGMSRRILFYRVNNDRIENITEEIGLLSGELKAMATKQRGKYVSESGLWVSGCGMDMIFYILNKCVKGLDWNGRYNLL